MKRQMNSILLKSLVSTEFLILQSKQRLRVKKIKNSVLDRVDCKVDSSLDLFELVKSLKQFVRVLQLLKIYAEGKLIVSSSNKNIYSFLDLYSKRVSHL